MTTETTIPGISDPPWFRGRFLLLTLALLLTLMLHPVIEGLVGADVQNVLLTLLLVAGLRAIALHPWLFRILAALVLPVIALIWISDRVDSALLTWLSSAVTQLLLIAVMVQVFIDVLRSRRVTVDLIFGSVAVYLLFGVVMAIAYQFGNSLSPGSIIESVPAESTLGGPQFKEFLYFSFVTLTSVGYGDLTPINQFARSLAMFEGVVGQLYLAILVARLVGIHIAQED
ncbi:MAG: ion channel [Pseudomonadota bacterium]